MQERLGVFLTGETLREIEVWHGVGRNDGWAFTDNTDEGKSVYGGDDGTGVLTLTAPSTSTDIRHRVGIVRDAGTTGAAGHTSIDQ